MNSNSNAEVLNITQAADILQLKKTSMYKLLKSPFGPPFTVIGKRRVILKESLLKWIKENAGKGSVM